jgi:hypothetical protein
MKNRPLIWRNLLFFKSYFWCFRRDGTLFGWALTKALKTAARVFSHHTSFFNLRSRTKKNTNAYQAAKIYFDASKTLLGINDNDWNKVLTEKRNNSNKNEHVTYAEYVVPTNISDSTTGLPLSGQKY